jgi:hypothetical protein
MLFELHPVKRDSQNPIEGVRVPQSCWTLSLSPWIRHLQPTVDGSGFLIREEYGEAPRALVEYYKTGRLRAVDESNGDDSQFNHDSCLANPFDELSLSTLPDDDVGGFILIGHPGIGEQ